MRALCACGTSARSSSRIPVNDMSVQEASVSQSIAGLHRKAPGSIGDQMEFRVLEEDREKGEYVLQCRTEEWMRNALGTLHGGMCATVVDQAMGFVAYSYMYDQGTAPTLQMSLNYHKPMIPGEDVIVRVRVVSLTRSLISMTCEASMASDPDRICLTGAATSFLKKNSV